MRVVEKKLNHGGFKGKQLREGSISKKNQQRVPDRIPESHMKCFKNNPSHMTDS